MALGSGPLAAGGAIVAFIAAIISPPVGLAVFALMASLKSPAAIPAPGFNTFLVAAVLLGCMYRLPIDRPRIRPSLPLVLLLTFTLYVGLQQLPEFAAGYMGPESRRIGYLFIQLATLAGVAVAAAFVLRGRNPAPFLVAGVIGALIAAILALGVYILPPGSVTNLVDRSDATSRVVGPFGDPNYFGLYLATVLSACLAMVAIVRSWTLRMLLAATSIVLGFALSIALSRAGLVALAAGVLALAFSRSRRIGLVAVGAIAVLALVVYPIFLELRLSADAGRLSTQLQAVALERSDASRLAAALAGPQMFATSPIFGIGFGQYPLVSGRYAGYPIESHNWYINILAEQGLVGLFLWIPMLAAIALRLFRVPRAARSVGIAMFVTYAVGSGFLQPPLSVQTSSFAVIVVAAALAGDWSRLAPARQSLPPDQNAQPARR